MPTAHAPIRLTLPPQPVGSQSPHSEAYRPQKAAGVLVDTLRASGEKKTARRSHLTRQPPRDQSGSSFFNGPGG
jgi:hypothetical protein